MAGRWVGGPASPGIESTACRIAEGRQTGAVRAGVAFLVVTLVGGVMAPTAAAQIASITVSAQVVAAGPAELPPAAELVSAHLTDIPAVDPELWTERREPGRAWVARSRVRNEPRAGSSDAGLVLEVVLAYVGS